jgi:Rieske Fe-S protein
MDITRRQFNVAATSLVSLTVLGCGREEGGGAAGTSATKKPQLPTEPFDLGAPTRFAQPGVYTDFADRGLFLVSDGATLIALNGACTHVGCATEWNADEKRFVCPCHDSRFDPQGVNQPGGKATRPLERLALSLHESPQGAVVRVDPTQRFVNAADWTQPAARLQLPAT